MLILSFQDFVNEKLQQIFIQLTLREEQEEYVREGIKWTPVKFFDNQVVCQLIEAKKPIGIFTLLDDVCNFPSGSDQVFHQKLGTEFAKNEYFEYGTQVRKSAACLSVLLNVCGSQCPSPSSTTRGPSSTAARACWTATRTRSSTT